MTEANTAREAETNTEPWINFEYEGDTYRVKKKFRRLKMLRLLTEDPIAGLQLAVLEEDWERLENLELEEDSLEKLLEAVSKAISGSKGN